jgi:drug/metabolite transporter (DMT)-like permease
MDSNLMGESAAIITSFLWTFNSILFASAGRKIGSVSVNAYRIVIAVGLLSLTHFILLGSLIPLATDDQWFWIGMSGIIGLGIGDFALFAAFVVIGPRRSVLMMALSPIFATFVAFLLLGEELSFWMGIGIAVTLTGVFVVILEREEASQERPLSKKVKMWGTTLGLIGAIGQGTGIVLAKKGMLLYPDITLDVTLSATLIRMIVGSIFIWIIVIFAGRSFELRKALRNRRGMTETTAGAFIGPYIGVTLSMVAVLYTHAGVAQTLMSLMPVFIIPVIWVLYRQRTSWRGILGAVVAVVGVGILLLVNVP